LVTVEVYRFRDPIGDTPSVTYGGVAMTKVEKDNGGYPNVCIFYLENPPAGTQNVVLTWNNNQNGGYLQITTWTNTPTSGAVGTPQSGSGTGTSSSLSVSGAPGGVTLDAIALYLDPGTVTIGADQSSHLSGNAGLLYYRSSVEDGAATNTMSWSWVTSRPFAHVSIPIAGTPDDDNAMPAVVDGWMVA
jgi:hypothetical protein